MYGLLLSSKEINSVNPYSAPVGDFGSTSAMSAYSVSDAGCLIAVLK
jgi:hypothetical protein